MTEIHQFDDERIRCLLDERSKKLANLFASIRRVGTYEHLAAFVFIAQNENYVQLDYDFDLFNWMLYSAELERDLLTLERLNIVVDIPAASILLTKIGEKIATEIDSVPDLLIDLSEDEIVNLAKTLMICKVYNEKLDNEFVKNKAQDLFKISIDEYQKSCEIYLKLQQV